MSGVLQKRMQTYASTGGTHLTIPLAERNERAGLVSVHAVNITIVIELYSNAHAAFLIIETFPY